MTHYNHRITYGFVEDKSKEIFRGLDNDLQPVKLINDCIDHMPSFT